MLGRRAAAFIDALPPVVDGTATWAPESLGGPHRRHGGCDSIKKGQIMTAEALRSTATWLAALFVGTMFVAASTSFAGLA